MVSFTIPEKLFILNIDDKQGAIAVSAKTMLRYGSAGSVLAELALRNKIQLRKSRLILEDATPTGDSLLDEILELIVGEQKPRKLVRWVDAIGNKQIDKRVAIRLAERNVIRIEKKRFLWIIPYEIYPQVDASAKYWVKQHLRSVVLAGEKADASDIALLSMLKACRLLRLLFTRDERKFANKKVDALVHGEVIGETVARLLAEIEAAEIAAVAAATSS
jgi:hypothetical protein